MKKFKFIPIIIIFSAFTFWFCQKKLFDTVELHGRLVHYITFAPIKTDITLQADDATTAKDVPKVDLKKTNSNDDGTFEIKSNASLRGGYQLNIGQDTYKYKFSVNPKENSNTDLGDVLMGDYTFNIQVTIIPVTNSAIDFYQSPYCSQSYSFAAGTSTVFTQTAKLTSEEYTAGGHKYYLGYKIFPGGVTTYTQALVTLNGSNTVSVTINY